MRNFIRGGANQHRTAADSDDTDSFFEEESESDAGDSADEASSLPATAIDLRGGADATGAHSLAALYLGFSIGYGHRMITWADTRFAHRFAGGPAPVRRFLPELIDLAWNRKINPGKVFDLTLPLAQVAEGYRAMDERRAIKTLLCP